MTPIWLLDDGPFGVLARHIDLIRTADWPFGSFWIAEATHSAALGDERRRRLVLSREYGSEPLVQTLRFQIDSPAAQILYHHLRVGHGNSQDPSDSVNLGEHQCIAHALANSGEAQFVAADKHAAFLALVELGPGRVIHPFDLWHWLLQQRLIDREGFDRMIDFTGRSDQSLPGIPWRFQQEDRH